MKKWILKAVVQKIISYLPFSQNINYFFQKYVTKGVVLSDDYFVQRLTHARDHLEAYHDLTKKTTPQNTLELGTGWYPVVPVCMFLAGAKEVFSVDITSLTEKKHMISTIEKFMEFIASKKLDQYLLPLSERVNVLEQILSEKDKISLREINNRLHLGLIIQDARKMSYKDGYFDLVHSNNTFEHVYPHLLIPILKEFARLTAKGGVMSHFIDMSDHFAHFDKSINIYHFLKYNDRQWKRLDNNVQPQSRLRKIQYEKIYQELAIPYKVVNERPGNLQELRTIELDAQFRTMPEEETAISHCQFVSLLS